ncbi:ferritin-like domain-containing protein [Arthrobacter sp. GCM10027362]|uniref:YciE/YciF ferroxidase family protein n=1 Tax=Arthrobacter sp. GCM10027362 TaxID=3273379 RepID=UPI003671B1AF
MTEQLTTPEQLLGFKLGAALTMERDVLKMLGALEQAAQHRQVKELLIEHAAETRKQVSNVERCLEALELTGQDQPCPVSRAMAEEGRSALGRTDKSLVDAVILAGALATEHYEVAVYETLITMASVLGARKVVELLEENLGQEESARDKVKKLALQLAESAAG